ncbi:hypothetical protein SAMN05192563_105928 [Paraburkholderia aspalathi]|uniref:Uncharacterized protein n=1 Tax=Paraburkholderia aspalathi TaxID=1324617 RepID=A0A1I7ERR9_9BURK|nr:hypothetical protein SAMN05192563_105928 [Paraburkholderia aspalathi]
MSPFNDPTEFAQTTAMFSAVPCDHRFDAAFVQSLTMRIGIVTTIGIDDLGSPKWSAARAADRGNRVDERQQLGDVVAVRAGQDGVDGNAIGVYEDVVLGTGSRAVRGIRASFLPAPTARTDEESTAAYERSICPASRNLSSSSSCSRYHTPALRQSFSLRQRVAPEPKPNTVGRWFHRRPVFNTNRMPFNAARSDTRGRPGCSLRRGLGGGTNGSISVHNSSSMFKPRLRAGHCVNSSTGSAVPSSRTCPQCCRVSLSIVSDFGVIHCLSSTVTLNHSFAPANAVARPT